MNDVRKSIGWADYTWNPITGCSPISEGCQNCYARAMARRLAANPTVPNRERYEGFKPAFWPERLEEPKKIKKPSIIFISSMGDIGHPEVRDEWRREVYWTIQRTGWHTFVILTKRPTDLLAWYIRNEGAPVLHNLWVGISAENQKQADDRCIRLLRIPAAYRLVSVEPMLGRVDIRSACWPGAAYVPEPDWIICGPETGPKARPCDPAWIEDLARQSPRFYDKRKENPIARWRPGDQVSGHRLAVAR